MYKTLTWVNISKNSTGNLLMVKQTISDSVIILHI